VIGGVFTAGPEGAMKIIDQLKPKIVIPMHYWYGHGQLEKFTSGPYKARTLNTNTFVVSKDRLPAETEIIVLKVVREGDI
ncbi:MAG: hypothetical protein H6Q55_3362, partial [Deltaproteobacteria bacterium]|nr:hypothetical protein [Deltaproteobacteria bacterium]